MEHHFSRTAGSKSSQAIDALLFDVLDRIESKGLASKETLEVQNISTSSRLVIPVQEDVNAWYLATLTLRSQILEVYLMAPYGCELRNEAGQRRRDEPADFETAEWVSRCHEWSAMTFDLKDCARLVKKLETQRC
jgi:hypothetical protein